MDGDTNLSSDIPPDKPENNLATDNAVEVSPYSNQKTSEVSILASNFNQLTIKSKKVATTICCNNPQRESPHKDKDDGVIVCSECFAILHYKCTKLPAYQLHRFLTARNYRKFVCGSCCGEIPNDFIEKCIDIEAEMNELRRLKVEVKSKGTLINSLEKAQTTSNGLISDKNTLIESQKDIIDSLRKIDEAEISSKLYDAQDAITQKNAIIDGLKNEIKELDKINSNWISDYEDLERRFEDQTVILQKNELECKDKIESVRAKDETINNLKNVLALLKDEKKLEQSITVVDSAAPNEDIKRMALDLTAVTEKYKLLYEQANSLSSDVILKESEIKEWKAKTAGVREIIIESKTPILNNVLLWLSVQLDTTPEAAMFERVITHFIDEEIENAKSILFDVCGGDDTTIGPKEERRGGKKERKKEKDCKDIIEALKKVRSKGEEPLFLSSKDGIMQCPAIIPVANNIKDDAVMLKINSLDAMFDNFMGEQRQQNDNVNSKLQSLLQDNLIESYTSRMKEFDSSLEAFKLRAKLGKVNVNKKKTKGY